MKIYQIEKEINKIAPLKLAQDWDNVGLLIGDPYKDVSNILITIDVTKAVVNEAKRKKVDMILSYHPVIWDGIKKITTDGPDSHIYDLINSKISVFSIHTAFDVAVGGVNDLLAEMLDISDPSPIGDFVESPQGPYYKIITFVPEQEANKVAQAIFQAGAGAIGKYSHCSFQSRGTGTFLPLEGSNPAIGTHGRLEHVDEVKLESIVPSARVKDVIAAMRRAHPYETPAFDIFKHHDMEAKWGLGRMGKLKKSKSIDQVLQQIKQTTGAKAAGLVGPKKRTVKTAAVCAGSCGKIIDRVISTGCDLYVTGELKHHVALAAQEAGLTCICLSHTVSERFALKNLAKQLKNRLKNVKIALSTKDDDPFLWKEI